MENKIVKSNIVGKCVSIVSAYIIAIFIAVTTGGAWANDVSISFTQEHLLWWMLSFTIVATIVLFVVNYKKDISLNDFVKKKILLFIICCVTYFCEFKGDFKSFFSFFFLTILLGNLTLWPDIYRDLPKIKVKSLNPWIHFLPMVELFIPQIATQVYVQLNRTMLGVMVNETASGYYQYSDNLVKLILALVTATGTVMLPHVANAVSRGNMEKVNQMLYKSFDFVSAIAIPMMFGLAAISLTLAPKYYGPGYGPVGPAMMIESIVILMIAWSNALGVQYLLPIHHQKQFTISVTVGALINIILNFPLIHFYGLNGAMWSTVLSEIGVTMYQLIAVRGLLSYRILFSGLWKYIISGVVMFLPVFWMNTHLQDSWLMMGLEVIVGVVIYVAMVIVLRVPIVNETRNLIINRLQSKKTH